MPAKYSRIVSSTLDLKNDIEFGYTLKRSEMTYAELLGSRAYQRAENRVKAEENARIRQEAVQERLNNNS